MHTKNKTEDIWFYVWLSISVILFGIITYINWVKIYPYMNSDTAAELVEYTKAVITSKSLVPKFWVNSNELLLRRNILITIPIYLITHSYMGTYKIASFITNILELASYTYLLKKLGLNKTQIAAGIALLLGLFSFNLYQDSLLFFFIQAYAIYFIVICLGIAFYLDSYKRTKCTIIFLIMNCILALYMGIVGPKMLLLFYFPLMLIAVLKFIWEKYRNGEFVEESKRLQSTIIIFLSHIAGFCIFQFAFKEYTADFYYDYSIKKTSNILFNLYQQIAAILESVDIRGECQLLSFNSINFLLKCILFLFVIIAIIKIIKMKTGKIVNFTLIMLSSIFISFAFMSIAIFENDVRYYFLVPVFFGIILTYSYSQLPIKKKHVYNLCSCLLILLICSNVLTYYVPMLKYENIENDAKNYIAEYAIENNYNAVYATYWNCSVLSGLTNGRLDVSKINLYDFTSYKWLTNTSTYDYSTNVGIVLTDAEEAEIINCEYPSKWLLETGTKVYEINEFNLYVFENNPITVTE